MILRYPGGKSKLLSIIKEKFKEFSVSTFIDVFTGGGIIWQKTSYLFNNITINDLNRGIYYLWYVIKNNPDELVKRVYSTKPSVDLFYSCKENLIKNIESNDIEIAYNKIICHRLSYGGLGEKGNVLGGIEQTSKYKIDCRWNAKSIIKDIKDISELLNKKNIKISNLDFRNLNYNDKDCLYYFDPPYYGVDLYLNKFYEDDFNDLLSIIKNTKNFVFSYNKKIEGVAYDIITNSGNNGRHTEYLYYSV